MLQLPAPTARAEPSAKELQQQFYEAMGDTDWELYDLKQRKYLLQKVAVALCGPPTIEGNLCSSDNDLKLQGYGVREEEICMRVFKQICKQAKRSYNGEDVLVAIIRVVLVTPKEVGIFKKTPHDHWDNLHLKKGKDVTICVYHVFSVRKCAGVKPGAKSCRTYIDPDGRVYQSWQNYLENNLLPKGVMVVPQNGEYRGTITIREIINDKDVDDSVMPEVKLTVLLSPAMGLGARVLQATDITSIVANIGSVGALIGAAFATPVVAPVLITGAIGTGVVTGIYAIVRSSMNLADRGNHDQNIGLDNPEARSYWINIVMSAVGISFSAATKLVAWAASSGTNIKILMNALQFLRYTNIATGVVGVVNSLADMIHKYRKYNETPSKLEIFQFTTSALFLGIGVMSNATAQEIVQDAQTTTINEARDALSSNVKRKYFDKVTAENRRTLGTINGNAETIRALQVITDKDDFFAKLARMNKDMNKNKVRVSLSSEGKPLINNHHKVSIAELQAMGKGGRNELFSKLGPADTSTKNVPTRIYVSTYGGPSSKMYTAKSLDIVSTVEMVNKIAIFLKGLCRLDQEFVAEVLSQLSADIHDAFIFVCVDVATNFFPGDPHLNGRIVYFIFDYIKSQIKECNYENDSGFVIVMKSWIKNGRVDKNIILMLKDRFTAYFPAQAKTGAFNTNSGNYDYIYEFRKRYKGFTILRVGEEISIDRHKIIVKSATIEKLQTWLEQYSQEICDLFIEFAFKVIALLTTEEVDNLNLLNPDEDIIMRVADFLFHKDSIKMIDLLNAEYDVPMTVVESAKTHLLRWRMQQTVREHKICESCNGIYFE